MTEILSKIIYILPKDHPATGVKLPLWFAGMAAVENTEKLHKLWPLYIESIRTHNKKHGTALPVLETEKLFLTWEKKGFIYSIEFAPGTFKIGMSLLKNTAEFIKSMNSRYKTAYGPLKENFYYKYVTDAAGFEKKIHTCFRSNRRGRSEIFENLDFETIKSEFSHYE